MFYLCLGYDNDEALGPTMLHLSRQINTLRQRMENENLERRSIIWKSPDFPHLDETELRNITCGVYQLKLSSSYMQEYLEVNSEIFVHQEDDTRSVTESPHIIQDIFVMDRVTAWYCKCRAGTRVVGVCSHIASILWYLGYARHKRIYQELGEHLEDASHVIDDTDSDQSVIEE